MRLPRSLISGVLFFSLIATAAAAGRVVKVLPHYLDSKGRHALSPSLYERDAYQAFLRQNRAERKALRFDVRWKHSGEPTGPLKLRAELRGVRGNVIEQRTLEKGLGSKAHFAKWASLLLDGEAYENFGELIAWRVTLWDGEDLLNEQSSFLW